MPDTMNPLSHDIDRSRARRGRSGPPALPNFGTEGPPAGGLGRPLPHSLEAEACLIGVCFIDAGVSFAKAFSAGVTAASFYDPKHGIVWAALEKLWHKKGPTEVYCVAEELKLSRELEAVGGYAFLVQLAAPSATSAQAEFFIEKVNEQAELREVIRAAGEAVERCYTYSGAGLGNDEGIVGALDRLQGLRVKSEKSLPAMMTHAQLMAADLPEPPMLIEGVMHVGRRTLLLAPSKASKTWTAMDMSVAVASGTPWMGFRTHRAKVLHIDLELPTWGLKSRVKKLCEVRGITGDLDVDWWSLDGYQRSIDELMPLITARAPHGKFGMIVIEPAYVILGARDENDNADVTDFMNRLAWLARITGAAVLCTHHFAKGDASNKDAKDRGSGAGAWVRAPDTAITITPLAESEGEDCYSMEFIERNMKRHAPIGVRFDYPVFRLESGLDLTALREAGRPKKSTEEDVVRLLEDEKLTHGQWLTRAQSRGGMTERTFNRRVAEAMDKGIVGKNGPLYAKSYATGGHGG